MSQTYGSKNAKQEVHHLVCLLCCHSYFSVSAKLLFLTGLPSLQSNATFPADLRWAAVSAIFANGFENLRL